MLHGSSFSEIKPQIILPFSLHPHRLHISLKFLAAYLRFKDGKYYESRFVEHSIKSWGRVSEVEIPLTRCIYFLPNARQYVPLT